MTINIRKSIFFIIYINFNITNGFYYCKQYFKAKQPVFSRYAKSCKNIVMDDTEIDTRVNMILEKYQLRPRMIMHRYDK